MLFALRGAFRGPLSSFSASSSSLSSSFSRTSPFLQRPSSFLPLRRSATSIGYQDHIVSSLPTLASNTSTTTTTDSTTTAAAVMAPKEAKLPSRPAVQLKTPKGTRDWAGADLILREEVLYVSCQQALPGASSANPPLEIGEGVGGSI